MTETDIPERVEAATPAPAYRLLLLVAKIAVEVPVAAVLAASFAELFVFLGLRTVIPPFVFAFSGSETTIRGLFFLIALGFGTCWSIPRSRITTGDGRD